ncbi:RNA polymerase factor sigma-54 [Salipaludibacillus agaradhaerens]|uniref:RNA polymerase factor sigma-54 n=1 Tax=Salipaludibacillus agaradhaerens TaxID=76935 RepID=UPI0021517A41|nr:RNA polymerase factor sigma-54 [Salipaludibacillus agaradhaerens]MCR6107935.1 RNA polymerase factor sigma-54 [Salipaludibacillus agaradhaerens]MCR6119961.1 RNA polymerase factor sigma-54 [Salipaludibacillus agaradhaerens]UJW59013.1 RNA polymerase factor sigma-54 [Bacillus sp. A116_S68]
MSMDFGLYQQQSMKLIMTNELRQAITILQYSVSELNAYLHEQQLENPLMDFTNEQVVVETGTQDRLSMYDYPSFHEGENDYSLLDHVSDETEGLQDYVLNQIGMINLTDHMRRIVTYLSLSLDENGYLAHSALELAEDMTECISDVQQGIAIIQSLEPYGIGACNLKECLLIQLTHMEVKDPLTESVIKNHLDLLAKNKYKDIAKKENVSLEEVQYVADFIQTLNPKPGALFHKEPARYVVPDVTVSLINDRFVVKLNEESKPKIRINRDYKRLLTNEEQHVQAYIKQKYDQVQWITRSIEQRHQTILKVMKCIVQKQYSFFKHGPAYLEPMTLKDISLEVGIHESTVSRATVKKYVQTSWGLYELKYFFNAAVGKKTFSAASSERVKIYLKRLINEENKQKPLSDQKIADILKEEYFMNVSRRTVAKYREELHITSSSQRKRFS